MIFQCNDLERALGSPDLMPDARAHAERCEQCARQLFLWSEISRLAPGLHEEWDSPGLWPRIEAGIADRAPRRRFALWQWSLAAAVIVVAAALSWAHPWRAKPASREFLTEDALHEVEQAEHVYARSIDRLSAIASPALEQSPTPLADAYREKLALLDSAIAELQANIERNRYNVYLQNQLASLYREKQKTLQEWLANEKRN